MQDENKNKKEDKSYNPVTGQGSDAPKPTENPITGQGGQPQK